MKKSNLENFKVHRKYKEIEFYILHATLPTYSHVVPCSKVLDVIIIKKSYLIVFMMMKCILYIVITDDFFIIFFK